MTGPSILDAQRRVIRTPEGIERVRRLVLSDAAITSAASDVEPDPQRWGGSGLHFAARSTATGAPALLKVNVPHDQLWWTRTLAAHEPQLIPEVFGAGEMVGDQPVGWVLWERVRGGLNPAWAGREFDMLMEAGVRFQLASRSLGDAARAAGALNELQVDRLAASLEAGIRRDAPSPAADVLRRLTDDWSWVKSVCQDEICHGDLHMSNVLCREQSPDGTALLIDYHPRSEPWVYDATKAEILNADPRRAGVRRLVERQAAVRSRLGMSVPPGSELRRAQAIALGWRAIECWAHTGPSPDPSWRARDVWHAECGTYIAAAASA